MTKRIPGRPRGEIAQALLKAAAEPGTVKQIAARALVGRAAAEYTASRLLAQGLLVAVGETRREGPGRPAAVVQAIAPGQAPERVGADLQGLLRSAWF